MKCLTCETKSIKRGLRNAIQKYYCKTCKRYFQSAYVNKLCTEEDELMIVKLTNEGVGVSGIGRLLKISKSNIVNKLRKLGGDAPKPKIDENKQEYEVDEMYTFIKNKNQACYITYAINRSTKQVIDFTLGSRTKENIGKVINSLTLLNPKRIYTDKLNIYPGLIEKEIHIVNPYKINHIERFNLTLRTHLKRLTRKTICFSKSKEMLEHCLKLYLWKKSVY